MKKYQVQPGQKVRLKDFDPEDLEECTDKAKAKKSLRGYLQKMDELQERLYAGANQALLIVLQAMDTGGKDSTIRGVFSSINPQGCRVHSFKKPTPLELSHHFLWRISQKIPPKGYIGIFNRSHYEDVLITRVHGQVSNPLAQRRFEEIITFENNLHHDGIQILKFYLNISKNEQKKRLQDRLDKAHKHWKFNPDDLKERKNWDKYLGYYEEAIEATSTPQAPWYIIPANHKWYRNWVVGQIILNTMKKMDLKFPPPAPGIDFKKLRID